MEFTKEQLQQIEAAAKEVLWPVVWSEKKAREHFSEKITPKVVLKLARIALASLEAEPAIHRWRRVTVEPYGPYPWHYGTFIGFSKPVEGIEDEYYYSAPPAPVSVPDFGALTKCIVQRLVDYGAADDDAIASAEEFVYNACRDAMFQGAEHVTTAYKLPANTPCKDAPEHIWLQTAGVWPENGEFSELTWCSDNQHKDDTLYVRADVVSGNSPAIPDGWKLVPIELTGDMTNAMSEAILDDMHNVDVWRSVLAAAPQQEV